MVIYLKLNKISAKETNWSGHLHY